MFVGARLIGSIQRPGEKPWPPREKSMTRTSVTRASVALHPHRLLSAVAIWLALVGNAAADFHTFQIEQIYSNADATVQFVVLHEASSETGQQFLTGHALVSTGTVTNSYVFPNNLPSGATANKRVLIATQGFAALGLVTADYVVPNGFLSTTAATLNYGGVDAVAYTGLPTDGVSAINRALKVIPNVATNFAGQSASVSLSGPPPPAANYQGLWWNAPAGSESGWGMNLTHQADIIFATWFTYDTTGKAWWLSMTAAKTAAGSYGGTIYQTSGPAFNAVPFDPKKVTALPVGTGVLTFIGVDNGTFAYTVNSVSQSKSITRETFAALPTCTFGTPADAIKAVNYQDLWWNAPAGSESGWGINLTHQADIIFGTWFTYGADGKAMWLSVTAPKTAARTYSGTLYRTTGPAFSAVPFDPAKVTATAVGSATFSFTDGASGSFSYTVDGVTQTKAITREVFATPGTVCG
jgi:hypothetical protein